MTKCTLLTVGYAFTRSAVFFAAMALLGCLDPNAPGNLVPKTVTDDPALPRIEVAGTVLHAESFGEPSAPAVVVLHGGPGGDYRHMLGLRALADDGYRVVFWDQRGAGLSQRHDSAVYTYARYLEDLRLVIEQTVAPGQPFVFVGESWGAMYATWFINELGDYGGRLRGAVLSEPGAFTSQQLDDFLAKLTGSFSLTGEQLNDATWMGQFMSPGDHERADYLGALLAMNGPPSEHNNLGERSGMWRYGAVVSAALMDLTKREPFDWTTRLKAFAPKVLFLRGELNSVATLAHQQRLAASYANANVVTVAGVGHDVVGERCERFLEETRAYFREISFVGGAR